MSLTTNYRSATGTADTYSCEHVISSPAEADEGDYTCQTIIDSVDEASSDSISVTVLSQTFDTTEVVAKEGDALTMTCSVDVPSSATLSSVTWNRDTSAISAGEEFKISAFGDPVSFPLG